jgi:hypothetical protein
MWRDVFATNADAVARALGALEAELAAVRSGLAATPPDVEPAVALLRRASGSRHN